MTLSQTNSSELAAGHGFKARNSFVGPQLPAMNENDMLACSAG